MNVKRKNLIGLTKSELENELASIGEKRFRSKQLWHSIYNRGEINFTDMKILSKPFRQKLSNMYHINRPSIANEKISSDGTRKWLVTLDDGMEVETVYIPEYDRGAACISSQVGCSLNCSFCHTGTQKLVRNLTASEIVGQFMLLRDAYNEWPTPRNTKRLISNIVMMGMGEPLLNFKNVAKALHIIMDNEGIALSKRRITLSTAGVVPLMRRCAKELGVNLAVSLHAVTNELRDVIVPLNQKYPIEELIKACREYPGANNARRITFEYVMLKDTNDSVTDAKILLKLVKGIPAKFNLIPFNPWPGSSFECSSNKSIKKFSETLKAGGYSAPIRLTRGTDILAACGQLKSISKKVYSTVPA